jgi:integrase
MRLRNLKPREKPYKVTDGRGLYIYIPPTGRLVWRYEFNFQGRTLTLTIGSYPEIGLKEARDIHFQARQDLQAGINPIARKQAEKTAVQTGTETNTFEALTLEFLEIHKEGKREGYIKNLLIRAKKHLFPFLGSRPIDQIEPPELLTVLRKIENQGFFETTSKMKIFTGQVFRYAIATGRTNRDITADLKGALKAPKVQHFPSLTDPRDLRRLLLAIDDFHGAPTVKAALKLAPLVFVRPGELRHAEWSEFDFDAKEWRIPAEKMKMGRQHIVPLSTQAIAILDELRPYSKKSQYLFPGQRTITRPISDATLTNALRTMGFTKDEMVPHGFRSIASTRLNELGYNWDWIERQLAHAPGGVRAAYNYADYLPERRRMMQEWADYLDSLKR